MRHFLYISLFLFSTTACKRGGENGSDISKKDGANSDVVSSDSKNSEVLFPMAYVSWMQDEKHGLSKKKEIEDITFSIQYKPVNYIICLENKQEQLADSLVKRRANELEGARYFDLSIGLTEGEGEILKYHLTSVPEYDSRIKYFAFDMQKDIKLVEGNDTLDCMMFHFERAYDVSPYSKFLLAFPISGKNKSSESTIVFT